MLNFLKLNVQNSDEMKKIGNVWDLDLFTMKQKSEKIVSKVWFNVFKNILQVETIWNIETETYQSFIRAIEQKYEEK